ncbi:hypothetical protein APY04_1536 [Hyphomicrobium sulfonivorans]|uniref:Uncharacterized protein n=1 Tax=Hyphomicrobium sulfonivorans TaxID=121290 RepID=A0A109BII5_HYPSL|nr:hypothetical protein APY04_1536 [Hyphomicrobium sulfonivorans]
MAAFSGGAAIVCRWGVQATAAQSLRIGECKLLQRRRSAPILPGMVRLHLAAKPAAR